MAFRSHLNRPLDLRRPTNLALLSLAAITGVVALVLWLDGRPDGILLAPVQCGLVWALMREIDPDHERTALLAAVGAAAWALVIGTTASIWLVGGLAMSARVLTSTTGRRPLPTDLAVVAAIGIGIGFQAQGWAAGFVVAVAVYLDERFSGTNRPAINAVAAAIAIGTTLVATASNAFGDTPPDVRPLLALVAGFLALVFVVREPAPPISQVDARHSAFLEQRRLHASRSAVGLGLFMAVVVAGVDATGVGAVVAMCWLAVISNEIELRIRPKV